MAQLAHLRQTLGLSKEAVARELGVTPIGVTRLEESEDPRMSSIKRYASAVSRASGRTVTADVIVAVEQSDLTSRPRQTSRSVGAWRVRAWGDDRLARRFLDEGFVAIGGAEVPNELRPWPGREQLAETLHSSLPTREPQAISLFVTYWEMFLQQVTDGDVMVLPTERSTVAIGTVVGPYEWHPDDTNPQARHRRRVRWLRLDVPRSDLDKDLRNVINAPGTITAIRKPHAAQRLLGDG